MTQTNTSTFLSDSPTVTFNDPFGNTRRGDRRKKYDNSKIIEPPYATDHATGANVLTEIPVSTATSTYSITVKMGACKDHARSEQSVRASVDLIVYGTILFVGSKAAASPMTAPTFTTIRSATSSAIR